MDLILIAITLCTLAAVVHVVRLLGSIARIDLPRYGSPGVWGLLKTVYVFTFDGKACMDDALAQFEGKPFVMPTLGGRFVILGPEYMDMFRRNGDSYFNTPRMLNEKHQLDITMNPEQTADPYHARVLQGDITRSISLMMPDMLDEIELSLEETFKPDSGSPVTIPLFSTVTHMVGRITNRAIVGPELCRNEHYVNRMVHYAETLDLYALVLRLVPRVLKTTAYKLISIIFGGKHYCARELYPFIQKYYRDRKDHGLTSTTFLELMIRNSDENAEQMTIRILDLNFGAIHTSAIFLTQALFELAVMAPEDRDIITHQISDVLVQEGGWTKLALARVTHLDSLLRECGRFHGLILVGVQRLLMKELVLHDGTVLPANTQVAINTLALQRNGEVYKNPQVFDAFRFSGLRDQEGSNLRYGFSTVDNGLIYFGSGRHACPGRFFAAMQLKLILATILLQYDITLTSGATRRPENFYFNTAVIPDLKAEVTFRRKGG